MMITPTTEEAKKEYYRDVLNGVFSLCLNIHILNVGCALFKVLHSVIHDLEPYRELIENDEIYRGKYYRLINYHNEIAARHLWQDWLKTSTDRPVELFIAEKISS